MDLRKLARRRWEALRPSLWRITQAAVAAALAWRLARLIPHHLRPFFAPVAAVIAMGAVPGMRGRQALELISAALRDSDPDAAARVALDRMPSLGMNVFARGVDTLV